MGVLPIGSRSGSAGKLAGIHWAGHRPQVRGVAMNLVDHPMGGGEGRASGGHPTSRTEFLMAKGQKTRSRKERFQQADHQ
ncbi:MAG: hypothetical protein R2787_16740 [Saprospiraceae bacterium]